MKEASFMPCNCGQRHLKGVQGFKQYVEAMYLYK